MDYPTPPKTGRKLMRHTTYQSPYYEDIHGLKNTDEDLHPDICESEDSDYDRQPKQTRSNHLPGFFKQFHTRKPVKASASEHEVKPSDVRCAVSKAGYKPPTSPTTQKRPKPTASPSRKLPPKKGGMFGIYQNAIKPPGETSNTKTSTTAQKEASPSLNFPGHRTHSNDMLWDDLEAGFAYPEWGDFSGLPAPDYEPSAMGDDALDPLSELHASVAEEYAYPPEEKGESQPFELGMMGAVAGGSEANEADWFAGTEIGAEEWLEEGGAAGKEAMSTSAAKLSGRKQKKRKLYKGRPRNLQIPGLAAARVTPGGSSRDDRPSAKMIPRPATRTEKLERSWRFAGGDGVRKMGSRKRKVKGVEETVAAGKVLRMSCVSIPVERKRAVVVVDAERDLDGVGVGEFVVYEE